MSSFGGWKVDPEIVVDKMPQKLATGFSQAFEGFDGAGYAPLVYCGSQIVNGINHMFICKETRTTNPAQTHVAKVVLHEAPAAQGKPFGDFSVLLIETIV